jgi:hypothetical protein
MNPSRLAAWPHHPPLAACGAAGLHVGAASRSVAAVDPAIAAAIGDQARLRELPVPRFEALHAANPTVRVLELTDAPSRAGAVRRGARRRAGAPPRPARCRR